MTDELHVVADLRRQLLALPDRRAPRRAPTLALAALAVVAAALGALALADRGADEAIAVSRQGDVTEIRVLDAQADPARLTAELRDQGVDATIRTQPVAPELVGQWYSVIYNAREPSGDSTCPCPASASRATSCASPRRCGSTSCSCSACPAASRGGARPRRPCRRASAPCRGARRA